MRLRNILAVALLLVATGASAAGINIFQFGASAKSMEEVYARGTNYTYTLMSEEGAPWFAQWLLDEDMVGAVMDEGFTNFVHSVVATASNAAVADAVAQATAAIVASNELFAAEDLAAAQAEIAAEKLLWQAGDVSTLNSAKAVAGATGVVVRAQALSDSRTVAGTTGVVVRAQALSDSRTVAGATGVVVRAQAVSDTASAITANNTTQRGLISTEIGATGVVVKAFATTAVANHNANLASSSAAGHVKLGTGLIASDGRVITLSGAHQMVAAAATLTWDCSRYTSFDITNALSATLTVVTLSNMVPGYPYTMTAKTGASSRGLSFDFSPAGTVRAAVGSQQTVTIPAKAMLIITAQSNGAGDYFYSTVPTDPVE